MALTSNGNAPYAPASTIVALVKRFRDKGLSFPVTPEVLIRAGVAESLAQRVFQSLVLLELIDADGQATDVLKSIRSVSEKEYAPTLQAWIKQVYAEVFAFADPASGDETEVRDAFRAFLPHAQQERMVKLFMALCAEAGLASEEKKAEVKPRTRPTVVRFTQTPAAKPIRRNTMAPDQGAGDILRSTSLPPELAGLMARLPQNGWTQAKRDEFVNMFKAVLDYVIPIVTKAPEAPAEEDTP